MRRGSAGRAPGRARRNFCGADGRRENVSRDLPIVEAGAAARVWERGQGLGLEAPLGVTRAVEEAMQTPLDITFRGMEPSAAVEDAIHRWATRLEHTCDRIERCGVVVEMPHRHHRHGSTFRILIVLGIPDGTIVVSRDPGRDHTHENVYVAIADAFRAARRQLEERIQIQRGDVKLHA